jgi:WD40 repeat protein
MGSEKNESAPVSLPKSGGRGRSSALSTHTDNAVRRWDEDFIFHVHSGHLRRVSSVALSASGDLLASGSDDGTVKLWDTRSGRLLYSLEGHGGMVNSVALSASGDLLATGFHDGTVKLWDARSGRVLYCL